MADPIDCIKWLPIQNVMVQIRGAIAPNYYADMVVIDN